MPYALDSPLSAAAGALGGFLDATSKKRQQDIANARNQSLDAQTAADTAARLGLERSNQEATAAYRKTQQDQGAQRLAIERGNSDRAATEAARVAADDADKTRRQGLIDAFQGQGLHYPKNWATMKPEAKIAYLQVRLNNAQKAGDSKTVSNTETEINRVATQAEADRRQAALDKQRGVQNANAAQRLQITVDNRSNPGGRPLTRYQQIEEDHWNRTHNPDGTTKGTGAARDTSGLSNAGKEQFQHDMARWSVTGMDPNAMPDPSDPKYPRKPQAGGGGSHGGGDTGPKPDGRIATNPKTGQTLHHYTDGSWK